MFDLDAFLRKETAIETEQREKGLNVTEPEILEELKITREELVLAQNFTMMEELFFKQGDIHIRKHNRYSDMPLHHHQFLELNYMYSGTCIQQVSGETIELHEGDLVMLDRGSTHAFRALGENDILINILLKIESINTKILQQLTKQRGVLTEFLVLASERNRQEDQYLVFRTGENSKVRTLLCYMLEEYYRDTIPNMETVQLYLPLLFTELMRIFQKETRELEKYQNPVITQSLKAIEKEYSQITLDTLADRLGFNKNYLGNLIKKETGQTFTQLLQRQRMIHANHLLLYSNYSIDEISASIGFQDTSYFFRLFKKVYGKTPGQVRNTVEKKDL